jgi:hypothetical protein
LPEWFLSHPDIAPLERAFRDKSQQLEQNVKQISQLLLSLRDVALAAEPRHCVQPPQTSQDKEKEDENKEETEAERREWRELNRQSHVRSWNVLDSLVDQLLNGESIRRDDGAKKESSSWQPIDSAMWNRILLWHEKQLKTRMEEQQKEWARQREQLAILEQYAQHQEQWLKLAQPAAQLRRETKALNVKIVSQRPSAEETKRRKLLHVRDAQPDGTEEQEQEKDDQDGEY